MNLIEMRTSVLNRGFVPGIYTGRVNGYLNDALRRVARRIDFYAEEAEQTIATVSGLASYAWPADFGRLRYVRDAGSNDVLLSVALRDVDMSATESGRPWAYALSGSGVLLFPTPDGVYDVRVRYWALPPLLTADGDVPAIPLDYHQALTFYATQRAYEDEDDAEMGTYWGARWEEALRQMRADVAFPSADGPRQARSMWEDD